MVVVTEWRVFVLTREGDSVHAPVAHEVKDAQAKSIMFFPNRCPCVTPCHLTHFGGTRSIQSLLSLPLGVARHVDTDEYGSFGNIIPELIFKMPY